MGKLILGDCLEKLKELEDNSVDSVVTDPPYGLSFMGKKWDYDVPSQEIWEECLRVLKPGGYLLAFAGTRTQHRMAVRIEDAGFEIRDMIAWVYGSGFPKSHNVALGIDKKTGYDKNRGHAISSGSKIHPTTGKPRASGELLPAYEGHTEEAKKWNGWGTALKPALESITVAQKKLDSSSDSMVKLVYIIKKTLCQLPLFATTAKEILMLNQQELNEDVDTAQWIVEKNINILEDLYVLMDMLQLKSTENSNWNIVLLWLSILEELYKAMNTSTTLTKSNTIIELKILHSMEWENIFQNITQAKSTQTNGLSASVWNAESVFNALKLKLNYIQEHSAIGNAMLKEDKKDFAPNLSPIIMSRKPFKGSVAQNVLKYGTGGINIDECRVESNEDMSNLKAYGSMPENKVDGKGFSRPWMNDKQSILDKQNAAIDKMKSLGRFPANLIHDGSDEVVGLFPKDSSRFFYCSKASKRERNKGLEGFEEKSKVFNGQSSSPSTEMKGVEQKFTTQPSKNNPPTVKPISLMQYLVRLVTPKGGTVLDPFMGSGSTGIGAKLEGFDFIGIELDPEYIKIAEARIEAWEDDKQSKIL